MENSSISSGGIRQEFLQLLVAQVRNQDPLDPVSQQDFTAQLAQFSSLEQLEKLNSSVEELISGQSTQASSLKELKKLNTNVNELLTWQSLAQGASLIGRTVAYHRVDELLPSQGIVTSVQETDDNVSLSVNGLDVSLDEVTRISSENK